MRTSTPRRDAANAADAGATSPGVTVEQLVDVATRFYLENRTQIEIARSLGVDPSTISRYLKRARDEGVVRIDVRAPRTEEEALGAALAERFGLAFALVVPGDGETIQAVADAAAAHVGRLLRPGMRLGVSWGQTLSEVVHRLRPGAVSDLEIAQMAGGLGNTTPGIQGSDLARHLAELFPPSRVHYLHAPAIVDSVEIRRAIVSDRSVRSALDAAAACELALVGIGTLANDATLVRGGHLSPDDRLLLLDKGAVGNVNTRFFDEHGRPVGDLDERTVAVEWDELRRIPMVIAVAGGAGKARAVLGALRTGCLDALVTDAPTARLIVATTSP